MRSGSDGALAPLHPWPTAAALRRATAKPKVVEARNPGSENPGRRRWLLTSSEQLLF